MEKSGFRNRINACPSSNEGQALKFGNARHDETQNHLPVSQRNLFDGMIAIYETLQLSQIPKWLSRFPLRREDQPPAAARSAFKPAGKIRPFAEI
jgi:hypothetical protein